MVHRVLQHTSYRARQVRDPRLHKASLLLIEYVDAMGGHQHCDPAVLDLQFRALGKLLEAGDTETVAASVLIQLEGVVRQSIARRRAA